jgi:hypothetical protein
MLHLRALTFAAAAPFLVMSAPAAPVAAADSKAFTASFRGTFSITFGPNGTSQLSFDGTGHAKHLGKTSVHGNAQLQPVAPGCSQIVADNTILTAANGDQLWVRNAATDCVEPGPDGHILIHGSGTYMIVGGTGRFAGASGAGKVSTEAVGVPTSSGVTGTFDPLTFEGTIDRKGVE